jgi:hypothetical protein
VIVCNRLVVCERREDAAADTRAVGGPSCAVAWHLGGVGKGRAEQRRHKAAVMASGLLLYTSSVNACDQSTGRGFFSHRGSIEGMVYFFLKQCQLAAHDLTQSLFVQVPRHRARCPPGPPPEGARDSLPCPVSGWPFHLPPLQARRRGHETGWRGCCWPGVAAGRRKLLMRADWCSREGGRVVMQGTYRWRGCWLFSGSGAALDWLAGCGWVRTSSGSVASML